ncbi:hypothetical protein M0R89_09145 [Halorussus limi]|uniref:Uncharacterized protein n=1 Tax=Halorussus limi TaxID=2938695 RepID=A0A8U0HYR7_9EURY|nr:hypothetical protein [Halorussus limi]UPV76200.1 hypothetical protein M0R89_09145 [Halorussus limi]
MISRVEADVLDNCISEVSVEVQLKKQYFTKEEIQAYAPDSERFDFNSFKTYLHTKETSWCSDCGESFGICNHDDAKRVKKTVHTLNPKAIASETIDSARRGGPLENVEEKAPIDGVYRVKIDFGERRVVFEFFCERQNYLDSNLDPFDLEFPVLIRDFAVDKYSEHQFIWRELLSEEFRGKLLGQVSAIKNKTTAVFAEYDEEFVSNHRTEIKTAIRDYFERSGYEPYTEVADKCPEIEQYGIKAEYADYVCLPKTGLDEKILITHGEERDSGWYIQRFVDGNLSSVEEEEIFEDLSQQLDEKIRYYKRISKQLSTSSQYMRSIAGLVVVITTLLAVVNFGEITSLVQDYIEIGQYSSVISILLLGTNTILSIVLVVMLFSPYIREKAFSWKMYPIGSSKSRFKFLRHHSFGIE